MSSAMQPDHGSARPNRPRAGGPDATCSRYRVALEVQLDHASNEIDPEDWSLQDLARALNAGVAKPLRMIHGTVLDSENDELSRTLEAMASGIEEAVELQWLATARPWPLLARALRSPRPSLEILVELEQLAKLAHRTARRLAHQGL